MAMSRRGKKSRLDQIASSPDVRRSPRLSQRPGRRDDTFNSLASITHSATLRPSLKSYNKHHEMEPVNVLNESGQSVPLSFDMETDSSQRTGKTLATDLPPHFFGLDESDGEEIHAGEFHDPIPHPLTPARQPTMAGTSPGLCPRIIGFLTSVLYKCGSLLYLAATAILCLDVILLQWFFHSGVSMRSFARFWVLPLVLFGVVVFLLGGNLIPPDSEPYMEEPVFNPDVNYSDISALRADLIKYISASVEKELSAFKTTLRTETERRINQQVELAVLESENRLESLVNRQIDGESEVRQKNLIQLKDRIWSEVNSSVDLEFALLKSTFDVQLNSLLGKVEGLKREWIEEAKDKFKVDLNDSTGSLNVEILKKLRALEEQVQQQLTGVDSSLSSQIALLKASLQLLQDSQKTATSEISTVKLQVERHGEDIGEFKEKQRKDFTEMKKLYAEKFLALEEATDMSGSLDRAFIMEIFTEELNKMLANESSSLRVWLTQAFASEDSIQVLKDEIRNVKKQLADNYDSSAGVSRKEVQKLIDQAVAKYSADTIGKFDFALESAGGTVLLNKCSKSYTPSLATVTLLGFPLWHVSSTPKIIIQPQVLPGNCWAFQGSSGYATIKLKDEVVVTGVSVDHIPRELSPNGTLSTAPKNFSVVAMSSQDDEGIIVGEFMYSENGPAVQEFVIQETKQKIAYQFIQFRFNTNHGNSNYTCVYRVRVHGHYLN